MTKINLFIVLILLFATQSIAQIERGSFMLGGGGSFSGGLTSNAVFGSVSFQPRIGYFVANKFAVGGAVHLGYQQLSATNDFDSRVVGLGLSPFARYYFFKMENKFNLFAETSVGLVNYWRISGNSNSSMLRFDLRSSAGFVYFIRPQIGIEAKLEMGSNRFNPATLQSGPGINGAIGFQIHLNRPGKK